MNDRQLEKIQKCLELAQSTNPNEAKNALNMASKLMRKYGLGDEDIEFFHIGETTTKSVIQKKPTTHNTVLINQIAAVFRVLPLHLTTESKKCHVIFVGQRCQASLAAYAFDVLFRQLAQARKNFLATLDNRITRSSKTRFADSFCAGWVVEVCGNLKYEPMTDEQKALIIKFNSKKENLMDGETAMRARKGGYSTDAAALGREAGKDVHVNTPVNGQETLKLA